jgi:hypothetical protein
MLNQFIKSILQEESRFEEFIKLHKLLIDSNNITNEIIIINSRYEMINDIYMNLLKNLFKYNYSYLPAQIFNKNNNSNYKSPFLAITESVRLIIVNNFNEWNNLDDDILKKIINQESIEIEKQINYIPKCHIVFITNYDPQFDIQNVELKNKIHFFNFKYEFYSNEQKQEICSFFNNNPSNEYFDEKENIIIKI